MKAVDILVVVALAVAVALAVRRIVVNKRRGKCACGGDCGHCAGGCNRRER